MKWDGRERGEERGGGSEESELAQAPDSRGSQLLKRTKLVRLFFQQGENFALQNLDAIRAVRKLRTTLGGGKIVKPGRVFYHLREVISGWSGTPMKV